MSSPSHDPYAPPPEGSSPYGQQPVHEQSTQAVPIPEFGQQQPTYGDPNAPQYGQPQGGAPQYGAPQQQYGQAPVYGQQPYGAAPQYGQAPAYGAPQYGQPYGAYGAPGPVGRPGTLIAASVINWIGSSFGLLIGIVIMAASGTQEFQDEFGSNDVTAGALVAVGLIMTFLCLASLVLSIFAFQGKRWAVIALTVLGGIFLLGGIAGMASGSGGGGLLGMAWVGLSIGLYWATTSQAYYRSRS